MVPPGAAGRKQQPPQASSSALLPGWNPRDPLTITVSYRGGSEAFYELRSRGRTWRLPGSLCLHDVMRRIYHR